MTEPAPLDNLSLKVFTGSGGQQRVSYRPEIWRLARIQPVLRFFRVWLLSISACQSFSFFFRARQPTNSAPRPNRTVAPGSGIAISENSIESRAKSFWPR